MPLLIPAGFPGAVGARSRAVPRPGHPAASPGLALLHGAGAGSLRRQQDLGVRPEAQEGHRPSHGGRGQVGRDGRAAGSWDPSWGLSFLGWGEKR